MALDPIDIGTVANDGTGDTNRAAFNKTNLNDAYLESEIGVVSNKTKSGGSDISVDRNMVVYVCKGYFR